MNNWCICWLLTHIYTVRRLYKSFGVKGLMKIEDNCFVFSQYTNICESLKMFKFHVRCMFTLWRCGPTRAMTSSVLRISDDKQRNATAGRTPLVEWSGRITDFCLATHNIHKTAIHDPSGIWFRSLTRRAVADPRLRPRGQWDRHSYGIVYPVTRNSCTCIRFM
jgi:hypothetical protein